MTWQPSRGLEILSVTRKQVAFSNGKITKGEPRMDPLLQVQRKVEVVKEILKLPTRRDVSDESPFRHTHATISCLAIFHFQKGSYKCICCPSSFSPISISVLPLVFSFPALQYLFQGTGRKVIFHQTPLPHPYSIEPKTGTEEHKRVAFLTSPNPKTSSTNFVHIFLKHDL